MEDNETLDQFEMLDGARIDYEGAGSTLAMGIISIPFFGGIIGLILSISVLSRAKKANELFRLHPNRYTERSMKRVNAAKTCAIVSLSLLGATLIILVLLAGMN